VRGARSLLVLVIAVAVPLVVAGGTAASTQAPLFTRADYPQLGSNHVIADLNGDGRPDLAGIGVNAAAVLLAAPGGSFGPRMEYPVAGQAQDLAAGDFDGDARRDLLVTLADPQVSLSLLTGRGDGTFNPPISVPNTTGFDSPAVAAADLNDDGRLDAVVAHAIACFTAPCRVSRTMSVLLGNGDGTFQPARETDVGTGMARIAVGDFDRDGRDDLAIAGDSARLYLLRGAGDGTFAQQTTMTLVADSFAVDGADVDAADFNRDGIQDLVVAIATNGSRTAVLIGNGDGTFRAPLILTEPDLNVPQQQAVADYNGDGFQDLALGLANGNQGLFEIRNGNGDGTFQGLVRYLVPPQQSSIGTVAISSADLNGDLKPDLTLGIGGASASTVVLTNSTGTAPPATPAAPALLTPAQDATPAQPVFFDWTDVSAAASYRIQIDNSSDFSAPLVVDRIVTASQFTAGTLAAQRHWWRVRGINSAGTAGAWSTVRRFTPRAASVTPPPPPPPGSSATLTVTATGRSGERVTSSPAGISVAVGSTGAASFPTGTSITLSATNGRDVVWSGACSSGGTKTRSCTFTLGANASVTANVQ
jgi:hypothetical protein